jgi:cholesterol oxidase
MRNLLTIATDKKGTNNLRIYHFLKKLISNPVLVFRMLFNQRWAENTIIFLVMQTVDTKMQFKLKKWPFRKKLTLRNTGNYKVQAYIPIGQEIMHRFAAKANAHPQNSTMEILMNVPSTAHILGGVPMGECAESGVIDPDFRVHNYPNMYILDGSVVQGNPGVNPSLTITALAEYAMSKIDAKKA